MNIYISASKREQAAALASHLRKHTIVSSWINESTGLFTDAEVLRTFADIDSCDVFIVMQDLNTNGKYIEFGYALGRGKHLIVYGQPTARAHMLAARCDTLPQLRKTLKNIDKLRSRIHNTLGGDQC